MTGPMIPADAMAKAEGKAEKVDFYAELTDAERAEEGLPPRETPKPEPAPGEKPGPTATPDEEEESEDEEDEEEGGAEDATAKLFEEIASLREEIGDALGKSEPAPKGGEKDEELQALLEHDDPAIRANAERLQRAETRLAELETSARQERYDRQLAKDAAEFADVKENYTVGGAPITKSQIKEVENYILQNPEIGSRLSIEQITRLVYPNAVRSERRSPPAKGSGGSNNGREPAVATIVTEGASGGASSEGFKPRPNETIESALGEARKRFGW